MSQVTVIICLTICNIVTGDTLLHDKKLLPDHRIVGGVKADIQYHPHQLTLQWRNSHICGASIISKKWAVTAGHCAGYPLNYYQIGAGNSDKNKGTFYNVTRIIRHPDYNSSAIDYDIALIQIKGKFRYSNLVQPVALPNYELQAHTIVNITGWGATKEGGSGSSMLMKVSVPIIDRTICKYAYRNIKNITERMICAGNFDTGEKDSCQGDSGGPLTANNTLYGIVSWGLGCAQPKYPGVYSNVANLVHWIQNITGI